jgi:hypothetical protein
LDDLSSSQPQILKPIRQRGFARGARPDDGDMEISYPSIHCCLWMRCLEGHADGQVANLISLVWHNGYDKHGDIVRWSTLIQRNGGV